jgi:hypothetical protein
MASTCWASSPQVKLSQLAMEYGGICKAPGAAPRVRTLGKIYANNVTDPDGDSVALQFQAKWDAGDGKGLIQRWKPSRTSTKASGSDFSISLPTSIPQNKQINWAVRTLSKPASPPRWAVPGRTAPGAPYFPGLIDAVWAFRGALTEVQVERLATSWFDVPTEVPGTTGPNFSYPCPEAVPRCSGTAHTEMVTTR